MVLIDVEEDERAAARSRGSASKSSTRTLSDDDNEEGGSKAKAKAPKPTGRQARKANLLRNDEDSEEEHGSFQGCKFSFSTCDLFVCLILIH